MRLLEFAAYVAVQYLKLYPEYKSELKALEPNNIDAVRRMVSVDLVIRLFDGLTTCNGLRLTVDEKNTLWKHLFKYDSRKELKKEFFIHLADLFPRIAKQESSTSRNNRYTSFPTPPTHALESAPFYGHYDPEDYNDLDHGM